MTEEPETYAEERGRLQDEKICQICRRFPSTAICSCGRRVCEYCTMTCDVCEKTFCKKCVTDGHREGWDVCQGCIDDNKLEELLAEIEE